MASLLSANHSGSALSLLHFLVWVVPEPASNSPCLGGWWAPSGARKEELPLSIAAASLSDLLTAAAQGHLLCPAAKLLPLQGWESWVLQEAVSVCQFLFPSTVLGSCH